jgi:fucose permease
MISSFQRTRATWLAYLLLAFFSYFLNLLGPITPFLKQEMGLSYTVASLHFTAFAFGILLVGLLGERVVRRLGPWTAQWLAAGGMGAGALLLMVGTHPLVTIASAFLAGLVGSLILSVIPASLSDQYGEQRAIALAEANVVSSLLGTSAPLLVGWLAQTQAGWRLTLGLTALAAVLLRLAFWGRAPAGPTNLSNGPVVARRALPGRFWVYWAALVLAVSIEFCMISWSTDYLETGLGAPRAEAAQALSLFLGAMILGRWAGSRLVQRFATHRVVIGSILVASAGFGLFWSASSSLPALAGLFITGLGVASLFPLIQSMAIGVANGATAQATARTTLASGTAILILPLVLGRLADAITIRPAYGVVVLLLAGVLAILLLAPKSPPGQANNRDNVT